MIVVHHGLFGDLIDKPPQIRGFVKNRLKIIMQNDLNLLGYHLPLDAHPAIGNNISLCKLLGIVNTKPLDVGYIGGLKKPINIGIFLKSINSKLRTKSFTILTGPKLIRKVCIISGGAAKDFKLAAEAGADTFICGEIKESVVEAVKETRINYINAGHYNTERLGIQNLGNLIAKKFKIKVEFIDVPCEI